MYFWFEEAPFCCSLSGWRISNALWYDFRTAFPSIISIRGTAFHPLPGQRICKCNISTFISYILICNVSLLYTSNRVHTYCSVDKRDRMFPLFPLDHLRILASMFCSCPDLVSAQNNYFVAVVVVITWISSASFLVSSSLFSACVISSTYAAHYKFQETLAKVGNLRVEVFKYIMLLPGNLHGRARLYPLR